MRRRLILVFALLLIPLIALIVAILISGQAVPTENPQLTAASNFPRLAGTNLLLEKITVPDDLAGEWRLILVAYDSDQQIYVDKWLLPLEDLSADYPQLAGYYVPLLPQDTADAALPIIGGMTLAAQNDRDRARTTIVFTDIVAFNELVSIASVDEVQLFLLDTTGKIIWRGSGAYHPDTLNSLKTTLSEVIQPAP